MQPSKNSTVWWDIRFRENRQTQANWRIFFTRRPQTQTRSRRRGMCFREFTPWFTRSGSMTAANLMLLAMLQLLPALAGAASCTAELERLCEGSGAPCAVCAPGDHHLHELVSLSERSGGTMGGTSCSSAAVQAFCRRGTGRGGRRRDCHSATSPLFLKQVVFQ